MYKYGTYVRYLLTLLLIYGVYVETGICTAGLLLLVSLSLEVNGFVLKEIINTLRDL